ncbi:MAG: bifunctional riboflavin kinase/FAD synthetase [Nitrospirota bacterium]|nr:bifunctional riboflavin kinase/FAD synthetase [Nitrospirota bacterium]
MKITRGLPSLPPASCPVLTIGNFDGQHLGHRALVQAVVDRAQQMNGFPMVLSFDPHPVEVLRPGYAHKFLSEDHEKIAFFEHLGIAELVILPFTKALASLTPDQFVGQVLRDGLGIRKLLVGENFVFGKGRSGTVKDLITLGIEGDFSVEPIAPVMMGQDVVSSTRIRKCLAAGDVTQGAQCLGRPYMLRGAVIPGEKRGSQLGWPTANIRLPGHRVLPADGVYATLTVFKGECLDSIAYIGKRPTFSEGERLLEVHIFDKTVQFYGEEISVHFIEGVRGDMTFVHVQDLVKQMDHDGQRAREILQDYSGKPRIPAVIQGRGL